jgi:hypothetical protein
MDVRGDVTDTNVGQQFRKSVMFLNMTHEQTLTLTLLVPRFDSYIAYKAGTFRRKDGEHALYNREF